MKTILFVCSGNYCRSPLAEGVARLRLKRASYDTRFSTRSAGTLPEYVGQPRAPLILEVLREIGAEGQTNPPHQITPDEVLGEVRPGTSLIHVGDVGRTEDLEQVCQHADALVIEATYLEEEARRRHSSPCSPCRIR